MVYRTSPFEFLKMPIGPLMRLYRETMEVAEKHSQEDA